MSFLDSLGHVRPFRPYSMFFPGLADPWTRRVLTAAMATITGLPILLLVWAWTAQPLPVPYIVVGLMPGLLVVPIFRWLDRRRNPEAVGLSDVPSGLQLLREGERLHERRVRLLEDQKSSCPLIAKEAAVTVWAEQIRLESDLVERQRRHLRGIGSSASVSVNIS